MGTFDTHGGYFAPKDYMKVEAGGSHEENPNGGVQIGVDQQGTPNLLEEGEPVYKDYVYSDNIKASERFLKENNIPEKYAGELYSKIADSFFSEAENRPNDPISRNGLEAMLGRLADAQEGQKAYNEQRKIERELKQLSPEELAALEQMIAAGEQQQAEQVQPEMIAPEQVAPEQVVPEQIAPEQIAQQQAAPQMPMMSAGGTLLKSFDAGGPLSPEDEAIVRQAVRQSARERELAESDTLEERMKRATGVMSWLPGAPGWLAMGINAAMPDSSISPALAVASAAKNGEYVSPNGVNAAEEAAWAEAGRAAGRTEANRVASEVAEKAAKGIGKKIWKGAKIAGGVGATIGALGVAHNLIEDNKDAKKKTTNNNPNAFASTREITFGDGGKVNKFVYGGPYSTGYMWPGYISPSVMTDGYVIPGESHGGGVRGSAGPVIVTSNGATSHGGGVRGVTAVHAEGHGGGVRGIGHAEPVVVRDSVVTTAPTVEPVVAPRDTVELFDNIEPVYHTALRGSGIYGVEGTQLPFRVNRDWSEQGDANAVDSGARWFSWGFPVAANNTGYWGLMYPGTGTAVENTKDNGDLSIDLNIPAVEGELIDYPKLPRKRGRTSNTANTLGLPDINVDDAYRLGRNEIFELTLPGRAQPDLSEFRVYSDNDDGLYYPADEIIANSGKPAVTPAGAAAEKTVADRKRSGNAYLSTFPRYAGAIGAGILGLYNALQKPDRYSVDSRYKPFTPTGRINLQDQVYNPIDQNMLMNQALAQGNSTVRGLSNSGLGPSTQAAVIAQDNNITGNLGNTFLQTWDANNQRRNQVIAANNQNEAQRAQFDYAVDAARQRALADAQMRNAYLDLQIQQLNNAAEADKYAAVGNQLNNVMQALAGIGAENFALNQVNTNPYHEGYGAFSNGNIAFMPEYVRQYIESEKRAASRKCGGKIQRKKK